MNTTQKHATKASAKRDVTINSSYERTDETQTEDQIEREIQNINVGRTLNFVFRQMNQQIISILHLIDARVVVWDGTDSVSSVSKEYAIPELDRLLEEFIIKDKWDMVKKAIIDPLRDITPFVPVEEGQDFIDFIEKVSVPNGKDYWRVKRIITPYTIPETGTKIEVPGIIVSAEINVMRTEGVLVEALLGQSNALDDYSMRLQNASVRLKELENAIKRVEKAKNGLAVNIVESKDKQKAALFEKVYPCCKPTIFSLWPPKEETNHNNEQDKERMSKIKKGD